MTTSGDWLGRAAGLDDASHVARLRAERPDQLRYLQGVFDALFDPDHEGDLDLAERLAVAVRAAAVHDDEALTTAYTAALGEAGRPDLAAVAAADDAVAEATAGGARLGALLRHARLLAATPVRTTPAALDALRAVGLAERDIVTATFVVGYVSYQTRALAAWTALAGGDRSAPPTAPRPIETAAPQLPFTLDVLRWVPWVEPVDPDSATPTQKAVLENLGGPWGTPSPFSLTLLHDATVYEQRSGLTDSSMGGPGLSEADREFAATVESHVNGCAFCASVHARAAIAKGFPAPEVEGVLFEGLATDVGSRTRAIIDFAAALAVTPVGVTAADVDALRRAGFGDAEVLDLCNAVAQFAWANRTMLTLGAPRPRP